MADVTAVSAGASAAGNASPISAIANAVGKIAGVVDTALKNSFAKYQNIIGNDSKLFDYTAHQELAFDQIYAEQQQAQASVQRTIIIMVLGMAMLLIVLLFVFKRK